MEEKLMKLKEEANKISEIKCTLTSWLKNEVDCGKDNCHLQSAGDTADMIKDLAEAEKSCAEALYYMTVVEAMNNRENMGYNHRHLNNGQFADAGRGHVVSGNRGYRPFVDEEPYVDQYLRDPNMFRRTMEPFGYTENMRHDENLNGPRRGSKYGESYDYYQEAKRHYTSSRNSADKEEMNQHAIAHVENAIESMLEMWRSSDDAMLKKRISDEVSEALKHMKPGT